MTSFLLFSKHAPFANVMLNALVICAACKQTLRKRYLHWWCGGPMGVDTIAE
jgi:hypothetical protein